MLGKTSPWVGLNLWEAVWSWPIVLLLRSPEPLLPRRLFRPRVWCSRVGKGGEGFWSSDWSLRANLSPCLSLFFYSKSLGSPGDIVSDKLLYSRMVPSVVTHNQVFVARLVHDSKSRNKMKRSVPQCIRISGNVRVSNDWIVYSVIRVGSFGKDGWHIFGLGG